MRMVTLTIVVLGASCSQYGLAELESAALTITDDDPILLWTNGAIEETATGGGLRRLDFPALVPEVPAGQSCPDFQDLFVTATLNGVGAEVIDARGYNLGYGLFDFTDREDICDGASVEVAIDADIPAGDGTWIVQDGEHTIALEVEDGAQRFELVPLFDEVVRGDRVRYAISPESAADDVIQAFGGFDYESVHENLGSHDFATNETVYGDVQLEDGVLSFGVPSGFPEGRAILNINVVFGLDVLRCDGVPSCAATAAHGRKHVAVIR